MVDEVTNNEGWTQRLMSFNVLATMMPGMNKSYAGRDSLIVYFSHRPGDSVWIRIIVRGKIYP